MKKYLILICVASFCSVALSETSLSPLPPHPEFSFDPGEDPSLPTCQELTSRFQRLSRVVKESHLSLIDFMTGTAGVISEWHHTLSPLEEQTTTLPKGQFSILSQGSDHIIDLTYLAYENADYIDLELEKIFQSLVKCLPSSQGVKDGLSKSH